MRFTVVILTQNAPKHLLDDLRAQTHQGFELLIADEPGIVRAMNNALRRAKGEIFVRIDDDVRLPQHWLAEIEKSFYDPNIGGVTGPTYVPRNRRGNRDSIRAMQQPGRFLRWLFDNDPWAPAKIYRCGSVSYGSNFEERIKEFAAYRIDHLEGTNWAMRTKLIRQVGGFDEGFTGSAEWYDTDVVYKIKELEYRVKYNPNTYVHHYLEKGAHYDDRFHGLHRVRNWLRFHRRHSRFHWKMIIWFFILLLYCVKSNVRFSNK